MHTRFRSLILTLIAIAACISASVAWGAGAVSGRIMLSETQPLSDGLVFFYDLDHGPSPSLDQYWRVPDVVSLLDGAGRFMQELAPGTYAVGAIKRNGPNRLGPASEGDFFILSMDGNGDLRNYTVTTDSRLDIGDILPPLKIKVPDTPPRITGIDGMVQNADGKPAEGVMVFAFATPQIEGKPLFVSESTNKYGYFLIKVHQGGTYYLKLREGYGGGPPKGGITYDGNRDEPLKPITVTTREITRGVILKGKTFPGRGSSVRGPGAEKKNGLTGN